MIKLKAETWYYQYTDGKNFFISDIAPIREDQHWYYPKHRYHSKHQYRIAGIPFRVPDPESSGNINEFTRFKDVTYEKEDQN